ncbi:hypothetical protein Tco_0370058 [Tanacetum coccineum]
MVHLSPLGHLPPHMDFLAAHVNNLGISLPDKFADSMDSLLPKLIIDALEERFPKLLSNTLKNHFPQVPFDLLVVNAKNLTTKVNKTSTDMNELVGLVSRVVQLIETSPSPVNAAAEGEKTKHPVNATITPTQKELQSNGTSDDPNSLAMVVQSDVEPIEEPPTKKFKVIMKILAPIPLNFMRPTIMNNIPFDQFTTQLFGSTKGSKAEVKRAQQLNKSKEEYLNCIELKDDQQKITKFEYQWFELHELASKKKGGANDQLLKNLKAKFKWVASIVEKLNISPPYQLIDYEIPPTKRKRKRTNEIHKEVFVSEDVVVDGMHRNLTPPLEITFGKSGQVLENPKAKNLYFNGN